MSRQPLKIAGQWVAVGWWSAAELDLAATLTSGQCFRWRRRWLDGELAWFGVIGRCLLELAHVRPEVVGRACSEPHDAGKRGSRVPKEQRSWTTGRILPTRYATSVQRPPPDGGGGGAVSSAQLLLVCRCWNRWQEPEPAPWLLDPTWWRGGNEKGKRFETATTATSQTMDSPDVVAEVARRYLRLDDDLLAYWHRDWLPRGWDSFAAPNQKRKEVQVSSPKRKATGPLVSDFSGIELRRLLANNSLRIHGASEGTTQRPEPLPFGVRLLRQDPYETLLCFVCSQNNHQSRIAGLVHALCAAYGTPIEVAEGAPLPQDTLLSVGGLVEAAPPSKRTRAEERVTRTDAAHFTYPDPRRLADATVEAVFQLGTGYRARYLVGVAKHIVRQTCSPVDWGRRLTALSSLEEQRAALIDFPGVGRKVADCVLLFAFDRRGIVPIDTHMAQVTQVAVVASGARRRAGVSTGKKTVPSLTPRLHDVYQAHYFEVFGEYAGWAHCFLFAPRLTTSSISAPTCHE